MKRVRGGFFLYSIFLLSFYFLSPLSIFSSESDKLDKIFIFETAFSNGVFVDNLPYGSESGKPTNTLDKTRGTCRTPWGGKLYSQMSVEAYLYPTVQRGGDCQKETRVCIRGILTGSYMYKECKVEPSAVKDLGVGFNFPDLISNVMADTRYSLEEQSVRMEMNERSIRSAYKSGANHISVFQGSYYPNDQRLYDNGQNDYELWLKNPKAYWDRVEDIFNIVDKYGLKIIARGWSDENVFPVLASNIPGNPKETRRDFITNSSSTSYQLYKKYWKEFLQRFGKKSYMLAVGGINELNLHADLDQVSRCAVKHPTNVEGICSHVGNYTTDELMTFNKRVVNDIFHKYAPHLPTVSGMGLPRDSAETLRAFPEFFGNSGITLWCRDTKAEFEKNLKDINDPFDYIDVHLYNPDNGDGIKRFTGENYNGCPRVPVETEGSSAKGSASFISYLNKVANRIGKKLYLGEFGDSWSNPKNGHNHFDFTLNALDLLGKEGFNSASIWSLEFYQTNTYDLQRMNLDFSNPLAFDVFKKVSEKGVGPLLFEENLEVMISHPFEGKRYTKEFVINALVDRADYPIEWVQFYVDGVFIKRIKDKWPYQMKIDPENYEKGEHVLRVLVQDTSGKRVSNQVKVRF